MFTMRKFVFRKPPDGLLEISDRVYVFNCCFAAQHEWSEDGYKLHVENVIGQFQTTDPKVSVSLCNFGDEETKTTTFTVRDDITLAHYPRHNLGCPVLKLEDTWRLLRSCEVFLSRGRHDVVLMHCERGAWPVLAFAVAALLVVRKQCDGEKRALDMVYEQAPRQLLHSLMTVNQIPSQLRYLRYVAAWNGVLDLDSIPLKDSVVRLDWIVLRFMPKFGGEHGCEPVLRVYGDDPFGENGNPKLLYTTPERGKNARDYELEDCDTIKVNINCPIKGDVLIESINLNGETESEQTMFRVMFNVAYAGSNMLLLNRDKIDVLWYAKGCFPKNFRAEIFFSEMDASTAARKYGTSWFEEKEGLPVEAFPKVQEIFSYADWMNPMEDPALSVLRQKSALPDKAKHEKFNTGPNQYAESGNHLHKVGPEMPQKKKNETSCFLSSNMENQFVTSFKQSQDNNVSRKEDKTIKADATLPCPTKSDIISQERSSHLERISESNNSVTKSTNLSIKKLHPSDFALSHSVDTSSSGSISAQTPPPLPTMINSIRKVHDSHPHEDSQPYHHSPLKSQLHTEEIKSKSPDRSLSCNFSSKTGTSVSSTSHHMPPDDHKNSHHLPSTPRHLSEETKSQSQDRSQPSTFSTKTGTSVSSTSHNKSLDDYKDSHLPIHSCSKSRHLTEETKSQSQDRSQSCSFSSPLGTAVSNTSHHESLEDHKDSNPHHYSSSKTRQLTEETKSKSQDRSQSCGFTFTTATPVLSTSQHKSPEDHKDSHLHHHSPSKSRHLIEETKSQSQDRIQSCGFSTKTGTLVSSTSQHKSPEEHKDSHPHHHSLLKLRNLTKETKPQSLDRSQSCSFSSTPITPISSTSYHYKSPEDLKDSNAHCHSPSKSRHLTEGTISQSQDISLSCSFWSPLGTAVSITSQHKSPEDHKDSHSRHHSPSKSRHLNRDTTSNYQDRSQSCSFSSTSGTPVLSTSHHKSPDDHKDSHPYHNSPSKSRHLIEETKPQSQDRTQSCSFRSTMGAPVSSIFQNKSADEYVSNSPDPAITSNQPPSPQKILHVNTELDSYPSQPQSPPPPPTPPLKEHKSIRARPPSSPPTPPTPPLKAYEPIRAGPPSYPPTAPKDERPIRSQAPPSPPSPPPCPFGRVASSTIEPPPPPLPPASGGLNSSLHMSPTVPAAPPPPTSVAVGTIQQGICFPRSLSVGANEHNVSSAEGHSSIGLKGRILSHSNTMTHTKKLKPLHWLKLPRAVHGSLWEETQNSGEASKAPEIDMSELENLFSAAAPSSVTSKKSNVQSTVAPKSDKVQLIDHTRAYNCEIVLSKVKVPLHDLMRSVLALEESALDTDQVENLIKFCPTKEEIEVLKDYTGEREKLGRCEQFFLELMKVPRVESKLRVFTFRIQFQSEVSDLRNSLNVVNAAAEEIRNSDKLKRIMQTILSLGNALNQGTAKGSAVGFRLDSLLKLSDTRARNKKITLMHYLCKVLADKLPEVLDFSKDLSNLEPAAKIQLKTLAEEMKALNKGIERVEHERSTSENDGPISETFCEKLKEYLCSAKTEVSSLSSLDSSVGKNVDALIIYFGEDPSRCPFEQVITTLLNFTGMFNKAHEENCKELEQEMKKTEEEKVK